MSQSFVITHYYHSGFSVAGDDTLVVFDYWRGEENELTPEHQLTPEKISRFRKVVVLISHEHPDHMDSVVFSWKELTDVTYFVSSDMPVGTRGKRMAPGDSVEINEHLTVTAFDSTDLGVSFLVDWDGFRFFHAGDLNFWHWREESTMQDIEEADAEFRKAVAPIAREPIDVAFFPVDPRQGSMFEAGANYFILSVKPRVLIPMHYFHRADVALEYARTASCRSTEVIAMPTYGDSLTLEVDEDGYFNIQFRKTPRADNMPSADNPDTSQGSPAIGSTETVLPERMPVSPVDGDFRAASELNETLTSEDPFAETDLPISLLSESEVKDV